MNSKLLSMARLSAVSVAVALTFSPAYGADQPTNITGDTTYVSPISGPVKITQSGVLHGTAEQTNMEIKGGRFDTSYSTLSIEGQIKDAHSLFIDGGTSIKSTGSITNIGTVTIKNTYNGLGNLAASLTFQGGSITDVDHLVLGGRVTTKGGTIIVNTIGDNDNRASEVSIGSGTTIQANDAYFDTIVFRGTDSDPQGNFTGTVDVTKAFSVQGTSKVSANNITGQGYVSAIGSSELKVNDSIDVAGQVRAIGTLKVTNSIKADNLEVSYEGNNYGTVTADSVEVKKVSINGTGSSANITGQVKSDDFQIISGSFTAGSIASINDSEPIKNFSNQGTVKLTTNRTISAITFKNDGTINAGADGVSQLDNLSVSGDANLNSSLTVENFNLGNRLFVANNSVITVDKLGTKDQAVAAVSTQAGSQITVTRDAYFNDSLSGAGKVDVTGTANFMAEYQEIYSDFSAKNVVINGMTQLFGKITETDSIVLNTSANLLVESTGFDGSKELILNDGAKVQLQNGSDGVTINKLVLNTNEKSYFQVYKNATVKEVQVNGHATLETYEKGFDSSITVEKMSVSEGCVVDFANHGNYEEHTSTASVKELTLAEGATLRNVDGSRSSGSIIVPAYDGLTIGAVTSNGGIIENPDQGSINITSLSGNDTQIRFSDFEHAVTVGNNTSENLTMTNMSSDDTDKYGTEGALKKVAELVADGNQNFTAKATDGLVYGGGEAVYDKDGNLLAQTIKESQVMSAFKQFNNATLVNWRYEVNHLSQRLGDVRDNLGTVGAWARIYGADSKIKDNVTSEVKANTIQAGADATVGGNWIVGGALSYTSMDADMTNGSADGETYSLAAYASAFFDCGGYVDVIGRLGRMSTDIDAFTSAGKLFDGSYDNTALGLSAEVGYHWKLNDVFYAEPQVELAYGYVFGDDFTTSSGVEVEQDNFQSLIGRLGTRLGAQFPNNAGSIYLHASINHEFLGDNDYDAGLAGVPKQHFSSQLDGTWVSYGLGMQINATNNLYVYGTLEKANGDDYQDDYRYSVGARYVF